MPSTTPVYTTWPTTAMVRDVLARAAIVVPDEYDDTQFQAVIDEVTAEVARETLRDFLKTTSDRYFDGSGTGLLEVDEFVTLNSVQVIGYVGTSGLTLPSVIAYQSKNRPNYRIQIARGSLPTMGRVWLDSFPEGRSNILVNADWGYGAMIPADLWQAVAKKCALTAANEILFSTDGREAMIKAPNGAAIEFKHAIPAEATGWEKDFNKAVRRYKRPASRRLRIFKPRMI